MICRKERKTKKNYCVKDFFHQCKIIKTSGMRTASRLEYDAKIETLEEYNIMCYATKKNVDFDSGGELAGSSAFLEILTSYMPIFEEIKTNTKLYRIEFLGEKYQVDHIEKVDFMNNFMMIDAKRIA